jgi:folate-binding protein YgfZ
MSSQTFGQAERDMPTAHLTDRGVVRVKGAEAKTFLDGLFTCDIDRIAPGRPRFGALLTPQGKILFDFIVFAAPEEAGGGYWLDVLKVYAPDLVKRLTFYKLRAKVEVEDVSGTFSVVAGWDDAPKPDDIGLAAPDPRLPALGWRAILVAIAPPENASPRLRGEGFRPLVGPEASEAQRSGGEGASQDETLPDTPPHPDCSRRLGLSPHAGRGVTAPEASEKDYHAHRIALGVPEGGKDLLWNDAFPHEALMDQLHGVDFDKGCYVGQEVVSRMQHRGTARTRIVPIVYLDGFVAEPGVEVTAGDRTIGKTGTGANGRGLAMIRLDRAADALAAGETLCAGGLPVRLEKPEWIGFAFPQEVNPTTPA